MEPPLPGYYQYFWGLKICLAQGHNTATRVGLKPPTSGSGVRGVNHQATAPPRCQVRVSSGYHKSVVEVDIPPALGEVNTACNVGQMYGAYMSMSRINTMQGLILTATEKCTLVVD